MITDESILAILVVGLAGAAASSLYSSMSGPIAFVVILCFVILFVFGVLFYCEYFTSAGRERKRRLSSIREIPFCLLDSAFDGVRMGEDQDLKVTVFLPDHIRLRHTHILGATGSGKTESVILNFLKQDISRGIGSIILDAKGDASFLWALNDSVPKDKLKVFDLSSTESLSYNPLEAGSSLEAAQRLFSSLNWSEEYYKSKAFSALQRLFQFHSQTKGKNPTIYELSQYLEGPDGYSAVTLSTSYPKKLADKDFMELSGLRDQLKALCIGHLETILSPQAQSQMQLGDAANGFVLYFRLQSLLSPQLVSTMGKLLINHLNYLSGTAHREEKVEQRAKLIPTYLDEFASFACPEFADLISKARSAGLALHFSHQSIGDLTEVSDGFINRLTDNSATKIVFRINDPDSADFFARSFGTRLYNKVTQRITKANKTDSTEVLEDGTQREAHQFRSPPDVFKTLPTGVGSVLIAHGFDTPHGASTVFKIKFPEFVKQNKEERK